MSHRVCHDVGNWVDQNVNQQVEQCIEQPCNWWCLCCNKWLCGLVWIVATITTWVVSTVCEVVADTVDIVRGILTFFAGLLTGNWDLALTGLGDFVSGLVAAAGDFISIATGGTLVGAFRSSRNSWVLRDFARQQLQDKYGNSDPAGFARMVSALGLAPGNGGFGLRLDATAMRVFIRSDFSSDVRAASAGEPDLIQWVDAGLDLKTLAGFNHPEWWNREWPVLVGDSGPITEADLDHWIAQRGVGRDVKQFTLFSMSKADLQTRLDCADDHSSELGLKFRWTIQDTMLRESPQVVINRANFSSLLTTAPFSRHSNTSDPDTARSELAHPLVIGCFAFTEVKGMGISANLAGGDCLEQQADGSFTLPADGITGAAGRYRKPDMAFKYTLIHEIGHTFGLCHVDGLLRIMFTKNEVENRSIFSWGSVWQYWTNGVEAGFTLAEGKKVWKYIVDNFDPVTLENRP